MKTIQWAEVWAEFAEESDALEEVFQDEQTARYGPEGHYFMSDEAHWELQKKLIQKLVEAQLNNDKDPT
jgi:hypothetical protein